MRIFFSQVILLLYTAVASSQTSVYHPFNNDANWSVLNEYFIFMNPDAGDSSKALNKFYGLGDSIIDGNIYLQIKYNGFKNEQIFLIRDDTINRKVYFHNDTGSDILLYDFSALAGDNLSHTYAFANNPDAYIEQIDSIQIGENYRKKIIVRYLNQYYNPDLGDFQDTLVSTFLIEGIGSEYGPLLNSALDNGYLMNNTYTLLCYFESGEQLYTEISEFANCDSTYVDYSVEVESSNYSTFPIKVYPNPATEFIMVESMHKKIKSIILYNLQGYEYLPISTLEYENQCKVDVTNIPSGIYFLKVNTKMDFYILKVLIN